MDIGKTLYVTSNNDWRSWLKEHFEREAEIWLIFPNKASGKKRLPYNDAVEEALCFGWIDSIIKKYDESSTAQRFTPRNPKSGYSQPNKERLRWLSEHGRIHPSMTQQVGEVIEEEFVFPEDIIQAVKESETAWKNYQEFSPAYQRIRVAYIDTARKRPDEFRKRLANFIKKTEQNKLIGYGGIEKYY